MKKITRQLFSSQYQCRKKTQIVCWFIATQNHNRNGNAIMTRKYYHSLIETFIVCKVMHMAYNSYSIKNYDTTTNLFANGSISFKSIFFLFFMWYLSIEWMNLVGINSKTFFYFCTICLLLNKKWWEVLVYQILVGMMEEILLVQILPKLFYKTTKKKTVFCGVRCSQNKYFWHKSHKKINSVDWLIL